MSSISRLSFEYLLRDVHLNNIYHNETRNIEKDETSCVVRASQLLDQPVVIGTSITEETFQQRLAKVEGLGFEQVYRDEGQVLLFFREKGGFCAIDRVTCKIDSIFLNQEMGMAIRVYSVAAIQNILSESFSGVSFIESFSYKDLPLISSSDELKLPVEESAESLLGLTDRNQIEQFEETGYALGLDCSWALQKILQSREKRQEVLDEMFHYKMECLPKKVQEFYFYERSSKQNDFVKVKSSLCDLPITF